MWLGQNAERLAPANHAAAVDRANQIRGLLAEPARSGGSARQIAAELKACGLRHRCTALSHAECTIRELRKESGYNDPALMMIVKDEARQTVLALPFFPGHA